MNQIHPLAVVDPEAKLGDHVVSEATFTAQIIKNK